MEIWTLRLLQLYKYVWKLPSSLLDTGRTRRNKEPINECDRGVGRIQKERSRLDEASMFEKRCNYTPTSSSLSTSPSLTITRTLC
jgi:hypothetical protein